MHVLYENTSIEPNLTHLYKRKQKTESNNELEFCLETSLLDASINLFAYIFSKLSTKHRQEVFRGYVEFIKHGKGVSQFTQINIYTTLLWQLKVNMLL